MVEILLLARYITKKRVISDERPMIHFLRAAQSGGEFRESGNSGTKVIAGRGRDDGGPGTKNGTGSPCPLLRPSRPFCRKPDVGDWERSTSIDVFDVSRVRGSTY